MPNAVVVAAIGVKGISVEVAVGFTAVAAAADAPLGVVVDCVTLAVGLAVCGFLAVAVLLCDFVAVLLSVVVFLAVAAAVEALAAFVVVFLVTALVAGAVLAVVVSETVLVAANA